MTTELIHGAQEIREPDDVAIYSRLWERMWAAAAVGDDAVERIRRLGATGG